MKKLLISLLAIIIAVPTIASSKANSSLFTRLSTSSRALLASPKTALFQTASLQFGGILGFHYSPANVLIHPGDHVVWNGDFTMHPLVSDEGLWPTVSTGSKFEFIFTTPGVYHFHCFFHGPIGMKGTVTVGYYAYLSDVAN